MNVCLGSHFASLIVFFIPIPFLLRGNADIPFPVAYLLRKTPSAEDGSLGFSQLRTKVENVGVVKVKNKIYI